MTYNELYQELKINNAEEYLSESKYGGYPQEPGGSVWEQEGKSIYTLIRHLKPKKILEIGNFKGVSSNHILQAVEMNGFGEVTLLDIREVIDYDKIHNKKFNRVLEDSLVFVDKEIDFDFIVIDGCHEHEHVKKELNLIYKNNKPKKYYLWVHDYFVPQRSDVDVKRAWDETENNITQTPYKVLGPESNCGFVFSVVKK
jgi:hypothetical protein